MAPEKSCGQVKTSASSKAYSQKRESEAPAKLQDYPHRSTSPNSLILSHSFERNRCMSKSLEPFVAGILILTAGWVSLPASSGLGADGGSPAQFRTRRKPLQSISTADGNHRKRELLVWNENVVPEDPLADFY